MVVIVVVLVVAVVVLTAVAVVTFFGTSTIGISSISTSCASPVPTKYFNANF